MEEKIPKIIHQMWLSKKEGEDMPLRYLSKTESFKFHHPDFEYKMWTNKEVDELISNSKELQPYLNLYQVIDPWICKCDVARYMLLYEYGGIYYDLDYQCFKNLGTLIEGKKQCFIKDLDFPWPTRINNGFIATYPKNPLFLYFLKEINKYKRWKSIFHFITVIPTVLNLTGPNALYKLSNRFYNHKIPNDFFIDSCLIAPLRTTIWEYILLIIFKIHPKKRKPIKHGKCRGVQSYSHCFQMEGSNWETNQTVKSLLFLHVH